MADNGIEKFIIELDTTNIEEQAEKVEDSFDDINKAAERAGDTIDKIPKVNMDSVVSESNNAEKALDSVSESAKDMRESVNEAMHPQSSQSMRMELRQLKEEVQGLELTYRTMSDAEKASASGQALRAKIDELSNRAAILDDIIGDINKKTRALSSDTAKWDALGQGFNVITSTAGAATGALEMLGMAQEDAQEIQSKLQASLAISNALSVAQNALQKESALMLGIRSVQEAAASAAITIKTAAEGRGVLVTKAATIAQAAFNAVANANPYVLLATAVVSVVGALALFVKGSKAAKEAEAERAKEAEKAAELMQQAQERLEQRTNALVSGTGALIVKYQMLQNEYSRLESKAEKLKFIREHVEDFKGLGIAISNVTDAENVFVNNTNAIIAAMQARVEAAGSYKLATEAYEKWLKLQQKYNNLRDEWDKDDLTADEQSQIGTDIAKTLEAMEVAGREYKSALDDAIKSQQKLQDIVSKTPNILTGKPQSNNNTKSTPKKDDTAQRLAEEEYQQSKEAERKKQRLILENRQITLDMEADTSDKRTKQIELDYDKQKQVIKEKEEDIYEQKYQAAKKQWEIAHETEFKGTREQYRTLTTEESANIKTMTKANDTNRQNQIDEEYAKRKEAMDKFLADYGSYTQKIEALTALYSDKISNALTQEDKSRFGSEMMENIASVQSTYRQNLESASTKSLQGMLKSLNAVKEANKGAFSQEQLDALNMQINDLTTEIETRNPFTEMKKAAEELKLAQDEVAKAQDNLANAKDDVLKATNAKDLANAKEREAKASAALVKAEEREARATSRVNSANNKAISSINKLVSACEDVGDAIGGTSGEIIGMATNIASVVTNSISGMNAAAEAGSQAMQQVERASVILAIISAAIQIAQKIANMLTAAHDAEYEQQIEQYKKQIEYLEDKYDDLGKAVERTYSKIKQSNIDEQIKNQRTQIQLLYNTINAERSKKKSDDDALKEYQDKIKELEDNIEDLKEQAKDAIFGEDINTAIDNFADAYAEAWTNGESKVKSARQVVKEMMQSMVTESIKSAIQAAGAMETIRTKLTEFYADGVLTAWEQDYILGLANDLEKEIEEKFAWANDIYRSSDQQGDTAGGFATMSQDSADELNGRFTAVQMATNNIDTHVSQIVTINAEVSENVVACRLQTEEIANLTRQAVDHLGSIEKNTRELYEMNSRLEQIERNTRSL